MSPKEDKIKKDCLLIESLKKEISKTIVGQTEAVAGVIRAMLANGHVLLEGVPGLAKTLLVKTLAQATNTTFGRVQFTPDLLPADITGITVYRPEKSEFIVMKGPVFCNFLLADEINRASPKVQSALLESMQERQVTIGNKTYPLPKPFFVLATQNPLETLGTYPLPEAQVDRFMFKIILKYPKLDEEKQILVNNIDLKSFDDYKIKPTLTAEDILSLQTDVKEVYIDEDLKDYIVRLTDATRNPDKYEITLGKYIEWGGSPRLAIGLLIASKAEALMNGKSYVLPEFIKKTAPDLMRHRLILRYEAEADNVKAEQIIKEILEKVPVLK